MMPQRIEDIIRFNAGQYGNRESLRYGSRSLSHQELHQAVECCTRILLRVGVCRHSRVGILLSDPIDYVIAYFAVLTCGGIAVPYASDMGWGEMEADRKNVGLEFLICSTGEIRFESADDLHLIRLPATWTDATKQEEVAFVPYSPGDGGDAAVLLATSGTSGCPKRVLLTHEAVLTNARAHGNSLGYAAIDRALLALPLSFSFSHTAQIVAHLLFGGTLVFLKGTFTPSLFWLHLEKYQVTHVALVPAHLALLLTQPTVSRPVPALRLVSYGAAPLAPALFESVRKLFPAEVRFAHTYGQSEAGPRITTLSHDDLLERPNSVGRPLAGVTVTIMSECGTPVPIGETGEICITSPSVMQGYYRDPAKTAQVLRGQTLFTGDIGYQDTEGFLYLIGRKRNMILSGGFNIYPEEIESCLEGSPLVRESYVYADQDNILGEIVVADVVPQQSVPISETALRDYLFHRLGVRKIPHRFRYVSEISKNTNNKKLRPIR